MSLGLLGFWTMFKYGSFLHDRALVGICRRHGGLFTDSGFCKYCWAHLVMSMTESCRWVMKYRLRTQGPQASNKGLRPSPLCTEISSVSLNILMMLCTVDDDICKAFAIRHWETLLFKYSIIFLRPLSQIGEPLPIFTSERLPLYDIPFTANHVTDLMSINLISCYMFSQLNLFKMSCFFPPVPTFLRPVAGIKFEMSLFSG